MAEYGPATYGDRIAAVYDERANVPRDAEAAAALLAELARGGRALELGIGTGRVALPLRARGVEVHGIDASEAMVARLRAKPGGADLPVAIGDFAEVAVEGPFALAFAVFNTFFALLTQEDQVRCFASAARVLAPDGRFLVQAFVPDPGRLFVDGQRVEVLDVGLEQVQLSLSRHDRALQRVRTQHVVAGERGVELYPVEIRYAYPPELDLMARLAGLELESRWADFDRAPFTAASPGHVSVWRRPAPASR